MPFAFVVPVGDVGNVSVHAQVWQRGRPRASGDPTTLKIAVIPGGARGNVP